MEPSVIRLEQKLLAGIGGDGSMTGALWHAFEAKDKASPLPNKAGSDGWEIRSYRGDACDCFVGVPVRDEAVPEGYALKRIPEGIYARFDIHPAEGWAASNAGMDEWLRDNGRYRQAGDPETGAPWVIERYDGRFRGMDDPESVIEMLIPVAHAEP